jgi:hypothetical protein
MSQVMLDAGSMRLRGRGLQPTFTHPTEPHSHPSDQTEIRSAHGEFAMATARQKSAARKNIKKAASAARKKRTIAHLPKSVRTALGKQAASVARRKKH